MYLEINIGYQTYIFPLLAGIQVLEALSKAETVNYSKTSGKGIYSNFPIKFDVTVHNQAAYDSMRNVGILIESSSMPSS